MLHCAAHNSEMEKETLTYAHYTENMMNIEFIKLVHNHIVISHCNHN